MTDCQVCGQPLYDSEVVALRARVAKLEAGGEPNSYEARMDAWLRARVVKLEAALREARRFVYPELRNRIDAALSQTSAAGLVLGVKYEPKVKE